jgi:hypothetical protein
MNRIISCAIAWSVCHGLCACALAQATYNFPPGPLPTVPLTASTVAVQVSGGSTLNILPGADLSRDPTTNKFIDHIEAIGGSTINVSGGIVNPTSFVRDGSDFQLSGGSLNSGLIVQNDGVANITGGTIEVGFRVENGGRAFMSGGALGATNGVGPGGYLEMTGGRALFLGLRGKADFLSGRLHYLVSTDAEVLIEEAMFVEGLSVLAGVTTIHGGEFTKEFNLAGGAIQMDGGTIDAPILLNNGALNLTGTGFQLNGVPIAGLSPTATPLTARGVTLTGNLLDGSIFSMDLNTAQGLGDYVAAAAAIHLRQVPEPSAFALLAATAAIWTRRPCQRRQLISTW